MTAREMHEQVFIHILFLDDRSKRIEAAMKKYSVEKGYVLTIVPNVKECLRAMSSNDYDIISLDHDLNGCDFEDPDSSNAGMEVVRYIEKTGWPEMKPRPTFWIHSSNVFAAHLMVTRLRAIKHIAMFKRFVYEEEKVHMKYDEKGNPL